MVFGTRIINKCLWTGEEVNIARVHGQVRSILSRLTAWWKLQNGKQGIRIWHKMFELSIPNSSTQPLHSSPRNSTFPVPMNVSIEVKWCLIISLILIMWLSSKRYRRNATEQDCNGARKFNGPHHNEFSTCLSIICYNIECPSERFQTRTTYKADDHQYARGKKYAEDFTQRTRLTLPPLARDQSKPISARSNYSV